MIFTILLQLWLKILLAFFRIKTRKTFVLVDSVYKSVSDELSFEVEKLYLKEKAQNWLKYSLNDPMVKILAKNSNLTKIQLETLLIDVLSENVAGKPLKYDEKARLRLLKEGISRGAFNRTLKQAKKNVIKSIYTIILLGYVGIFESTQLDPYIEVAGKLQTYIKAYKDILKGRKLTDEHLRIMNMLRKELEASLTVLSNGSIREKL